jgi:hypothetical protein
VEKGTRKVNVMGNKGQAMEGQHFHFHFDNAKKKRKRVTSAEMEDDEYNDSSNNEDSHSSCAGTQRKPTRNEPVQDTGNHKLARGNASIVDSLDYPHVTSFLRELDNKNRSSGTLYSTLYGSCISSKLGYRRIDNVINA